MSFKSSIESFLTTAGLPDNARNFAQGLMFIVNKVEDELVTKKAVRDIFEGKNRNADSGRILNPELAAYDKIMFNQFKDSLSDSELKTKISNLITEFETWLNA